MDESYQKWKQNTGAMSDYAGVLSLVAPGAQTLSKEMLSLAGAQQLVAENSDAVVKTQQAVADGAVSSSDSMASLSVKYEEAAGKLVNYRVAMEKIAEARKIEGEATVRMAELTGIESEALFAAVEAKQSYADAMGVVANAQERELALMRSNIESITQLAAAQGQSEVPAVKEVIKALQQKVMLKEAEIEKSQQSRDAAVAEATQAALTAQTYVDNANRVSEYRAALDAATVKLKEYERLQQDGLVTDQQVRQARNDLTVAVRLYGDAIEDSIAKKKRDGELSVQIAQLAGSEAGTRNVAAQAAKNNANELAQLATYRQSEVSAVQQQIAGLERLRAAMGTLPPEQQKELDNLRAKLALKQEESAQVDRSVTAAKLEAEQLAVNAQAYQDNADKLYLYRGAAQEAEAAVRRLEAAHAAGTATEAEVSDARVKAAGALALYRDALNDASDAADRKIDTLKRELDVTQAALGVDMERARTALKIAEANGDERAAVQAKVEMKRIELRMAQASMEASAAEANAIVAAAEAERAAAEASGTLTAAKKAEIDARLAAAKVKALESERGAELVKQIEAEIDALGRLTSAKNQAASAGSSGSSGTGSGTGSGTATGTGNAAKQNDTRTAGVDWRAQLFKQGATVDEMNRAMQYVDDFFAKASQDNPFRGGSVDLYVGTINRNMEQAVRDALQRARREEGGSSVSDRTFVAQDGTGNLLKQNPLLQPVTINIGGQSHTLDLGGQKDVATLENMLRQLQEGARRF